MTEGAKTLTFCAVAAATSFLAFATRPRPVQVEADDKVGQALFAEFDDPTKAANLRIVTHREDVGETSTFEVAKKSGSWVIPSHNDYPADAENQMRDVATSFVDLDVLSVQDATAGEHELYGVVEPNAEGGQSGQAGIGTLVEIANESGKKLCELIIGKEVKDAEGQRYVRMPGKDRVYVVTVDPSKFSTKFEDWIEEDLLQLSTFDVEELVLNDYTVQLGVTLSGQPVVTNFNQQFKLVAKENTSENRWDAVEFFEASGDTLQQSQLGPGEELNKERLDGLKNALDDLKIVDVERKPAGLGADLRAEKGFMNDQEGIGSLMQKGFYPVAAREGEGVELLSSDGEVLVHTKDGVEYVMRFGQVASLNRDDEAGSVNRWLFVTAQLNDAMFPEPELEDLPASADPADPADPTDPADPADPADPTDPTDPTDQPEDEADAREQMRAERERILKENQRKLDEYNEKLDKAKEKVGELNFRFADWYYIISDDVYKKIRLSRSDVIVLNEEAKEQGIGIDALQKLESEVEGLGSPAEVDADAS